jgi:hypothetical protein
VDPIDKPFGDDVEEQRLDLRDKSVAEILSILTAPSIGVDAIDDPQSPAVPVAPSSPPVAPDSSGSTKATPITPVIADAPPMTPGVEDRPLEGFAERFSNDSGLSEPPIQTGQRPAVARLGHLPFVSILAAIVAIGVALMTFPNTVWKWSGEMSGLMTSLFEAPSRAKTPTKLPRLVAERLRQRTAPTGYFAQ